MKYYIALGSNVGDRSNYLQQAISSLEMNGQVPNVSKIYQSKAQGYTEQADFLNQVCILNTPLRPYRLLRKLKVIEAALGRQFNRHWGPRVIDLDILDWEGGEIKSAILKIPHPLIQEREFVLRPLNDVVPTYQTRTGKTIAVLLNNFDQTDSVVIYTQVNHQN